ncbi:MAG: cation:proton antiporter [Crocinitomicaceae bacterium]|nr:cation:proton antiporter [Crocinitomicaceae bacterium]
MRGFKNAIFYIVLTGLCILAMVWIVNLGGELETGRNISTPVVQNNWSAFLDSMIHNLEHPLAILLAQIVTIIFAARLFGWLFRKIGQPTVIGEIIAGIVLGPSLIGIYFPEFSAALFPVQSLGNLQFLSQIGLILFMFVIGMELDLTVLKNKAKDAVVVSHASIIIPFALGMGLAYFIYEAFAPVGVPFIAFGLFLGIAMSITAFPVLARIVQERGIHKTKLGTVVITCAAADDITAWCILAAVIAIVKAGSFVSALYIIALATIYVLLMIKVVRPFLKRVGDLHASQETLSKPIVAIFFLTLIISAYATEIIGIHALFGAFMAGAIMPENVKFRNIFIEKVEDVSLVLLLPLFFVFTGLRTEIGLIDDPYLWKITALIIAVAVIGKFVGSALAAKFVGQNWKDSLTIGALMNTRGLMELVVLNIGYDLGVLTPEIFTMMVIMALVTTFMTGPVLDLINWLFRKVNYDETSVQTAPVSKYNILVSFGNPERGKSLLRIAHFLVKKRGKNASITALHLSPSNELHHFNADEYEKEIFTPVVDEAATLKQKITTRFKASNDINDDIVETANNGEFDLLLVGVGQSIFEGSLLGKILGFTTRIINPDRLLGQVTGKENLFESSPFDERSRMILSKSEVPVGCLIDRNFEKVDKVLLPVFDSGDRFLTRYAQKLIKNAGANVQVLNLSDSVKNKEELTKKVQALELTFPGQITLISQTEIEQEQLLQSDLLLISAESWKKLMDSKSSLLSEVPSTLILSEPQA